MSNHFPERENGQTQENKHARSLYYLLHLLRALARTKAGDDVMDEIIERFCDRSHAAVDEVGVPFSAVADNNTGDERVPN